ncbi:SGNH/GDSL hydrolase family protein [Thiofilum flexile]|uniref:SGNH/GDSL hydrolase family protein n=1 Tax=Thiofilum flexile TaxID=125627 RepID=UPI00037D2BAB|nr:DUF4886 domain-containing protein [Thiofilum flexile]
MEKRLAYRVLFIGNSYTEGLRTALVPLLPATLQDSVFVEFFTRGGSNLAWHWENQELQEKIRQGRWDYVVLQEQSQTPTLVGQAPYENFVQALGQFCSLIKASGAVPVLFMTWGACYGDRRNPSISPDYWVMQQHLSDAYRSMAQHYETHLVPVGEAWAYVRRHAVTLGDRLYQDDGHHPSKLGNYLSACMFSRYLWQKDVLTHPTVKLTPLERESFMAAIASTLKQGQILS